jgi:hypothetical protein
MVLLSVNRVDFDPWETAITIPCSQFKTPLKKLQKNFTSFSIYVIL